jgi:hypothetical protein
MLMLMWTDDPGSSVLVMTALAAVAFISLLVLRSAIELVRTWRARHIRPVHSPQD